MAALVTGGGGTSEKDDDGNDEKITANAMERFKKYFSVDKLLEKVQKHNLDSKKEMRPSTWSLYGKLYDTSNEEGERNFFADFRSHIWITYRCNFLALVPSPPTFPLTSDGGWGCMIRSGQMMLAEVLLRRQLGRGWRLDKPVRDSRNRSYSIAHKDVLTQFIDVPNVKCNFSIHRIVQVGLQYGKRPGDWYGPEAISIVLRDLVNSHHHLNVQVYVASSGVVVKKDALDLVREKKKSGVKGDGGCTSLEGVVKRKTDSLPDSNRHPSSGKLEQEWSSDLFLIIPCSILGRGSSLKINEKFINALCKVLDLPQSVGFIGGRPRHSVYFNGRAGDDFFYMDPHRVQKTVNYGPCFPTLDELLSYHCPTPRRMNAREIDASLALGFLIRSEAEFSDFCNNIDNIGRQAPLFFGLVDVNPLDSMSVDLVKSTSNSDHGSPTSNMGDDTVEDDWDLL